MSLGRSEQESVVSQVRDALEREPRVQAHRHRIRVELDHGDVVLEGEVGSIAAKKIALERAAAVDGACDIVDRLRVAAGAHASDGEVRDGVCALLGAEAEFDGCVLRAWTGDGGVRLVRAPAPADGDIEVSVVGGVVTLDGVVGSLAHKRLAGVLAWWTAGCRDVVNALEVVPAEEDNDGEILDALGLVLEIDPLVQAGEITVRCHDAHIVLEGWARNEAERQRIELDAWALHAVAEVTNRLRTRS